jgi:superfamily II DNA or RNA helicase
MKHTKPTAFLIDKLYLPVETVKENLVVKNFDLRIFAQDMCDKCPIFKNGERFCDMCSTCDGYKGRFKTYKDAVIRGKEYFGIPSGDLELVQEQLNIDLADYDLIDKRSDVLAKHPLKFTGKLRNGSEVINGTRVTNQVGLIQDFFEIKRGIIESPARSGKTVNAVYIICKYKRRTLFIAHEYQLLRQAYRTILDFTNIAQVRRESGKKIAGIITCEADWNENWDIVLCTYQQFITERGFARIRKYLINKFGLMCLDEAHRSAAEAYSNFINKLDMKYKFALTATPTRKDKKHIIMHQILGPVVSISKLTGVIPDTKIVYTGFKSKYDWKGRAAYNYANRWLSEKKERNKLIIKNIFDDLRANSKHSIIIPVMFIDHVKHLVKLINDQARYNNENKEEKWPIPLAMKYYRESDTTSILKKARSGEIRVVVAIRSKVKDGIDVPRWSIQYLTVPMNNNEDFYQMTQRICTPMEGKPNPILKIFVDEIGLSRGCFRPTYLNGVVKLKYKIDEENKKIATKLLSRKPFNEEDEVIQW